MLFRLSRGESTRVWRTGKWVCPNCKSEQTAVHYQILEEWSLWGFGLGGDHLIKEYITCEGCQSWETPENYTYNAATKTFDPVQWDCPWCKNLNPNTTYRCRKCERSLI